MSQWLPPSEDEDPELWALWRESGTDQSFEQWWLDGFVIDDEPGDEWDTAEAEDADDDEALSGSVFEPAPGREFDEAIYVECGNCGQVHDPEDQRICDLEHGAEDEHEHGWGAAFDDVGDEGDGSWDDIDHEALLEDREADRLLFLAQFGPDAGHDDEDDEGELLTGVACSFGPHSFGDQCHACGYGSDFWDEVQPEDFMGGFGTDEFDFLEAELMVTPDEEFSVADRVQIAAWLDDELRSEWIADTDGVISFDDWLLSHENDDVFLEDAWDVSKWLFRGEEGDLAQPPPDDPEDWWQLGFDHADMLRELAEWEQITAGDKHDQGADELAAEVTVDEDDDDLFTDEEVQAEWFDHVLVATAHEWGWDGWSDVTGDAGWGGDTWGGDGWGDGKYGDGWGGDAFDFGNSFDGWDWD